jgi:hypothetical protein
MKVRRVGWLVLLTLAACRLAPGAPHVAASHAPTVATNAKTSPGASAAPKANLLLKPTGQTTTLTGTIAVDGGYIVSQGAGNIVSQGAGNIVSQGAGNIVSQGAGNIVSQGAGNIVSQGAGNIVSQGAGNIVAAGAGNLITNDGGSLISNDGGSIVAQGAGNIIAGGSGGAAAFATDGITVLPAGIVSQGAGNIVSQGAGNIVSQGAGNYRLAAAADSHEQLLAAGMAVSAFSLSRHAYVPVGADAAGRPVYTVYSNLKGGYEIYPPGNASDVVVVAAVPGATDRRLSYNLLDHVADHVDEDTAMVTKLLRGLMYQRFLIYIIQGNDNTPTEFGDGDALFVQLTGDFIPRIRAAGRKLAGADPAVQRAVALKMGDVLLEGGLPDGSQGPVKTFIEVMRQVRDGDASHGPAYLTSDALKALVARAHDETSLFDRRLPFDFGEFRKPADLGDFLVRGLYGPNIAPLNQLVDQLLIDRGASEQLRKDLETARQAFIVALAQRMLDPDLQAKVLAQVELP